MPKDKFLAGSLHALLYIVALREKEKGLPLLDILLSMRDSPELLSGDHSYDKGFNATIDQLFAYLTDDASEPR